MNARRKPETRAEKAVAGVLIAVSLVIVSIAQRDLHRRPAEQVRGDKRIWRVVCLNALGAIAYLARGRR